jgi:hypothetical protein
MPSNCDLIITADDPSRTAELRLLDEHGVQLAYRQTDFKTIAVSHQQGLFDLRNYLHHYVEEGEEAASVAEIGVCIAEEVLGEDIFRHLRASEAQRAPYPVTRRHRGGQSPGSGARPCAVGDRTGGGGPAHAGRAQPPRPCRP